MSAGIINLRVHRNNTWTSRAFDVRRIEQLTNIVKPIMPGVRTRMLYDAEPFAIGESIADILLLVIESGGEAKITVALAGER